ncbi:MAG: hypothetical protein KF764_08505 [Labilithrix sp.]|nr:hypothetical protein [Labilithrix sp.]
MAGHGLHSAVAGRAPDDEVVAGEEASASPPLSVQVGGDDDTQPGEHCLVCAARAQLEGAAVRAGVERITTVSSFERPRAGGGTSALERAKAMVCLPGGVIATGDGSSREEAIAAALEQAGVEP